MSRIPIELLPGDSIIRPCLGTRMYLASGNSIDLLSNEWRVSRGFAGVYLIEPEDPETLEVFRAMEVSRQPLRSDLVGLDLVRKYTEESGLLPNVPVLSKTWNIYTNRFRGLTSSRVRKAIREEEDGSITYVREKASELRKAVYWEVNAYLQRSLGAPRDIFGEVFCQIVPRIYKHESRESYSGAPSHSLTLYSTPFRFDI